MAQRGGGGAGQALVGGDEWGAEDSVEAGRVNDEHLAGRERG